MADSESRPSRREGPLSADAEGSPAERSADPELHVLHVEHSIEDIELAARALAQAGLRACVDGAETEQALVQRLHDREYDIILADFSLPGWNGMEALAVARRCGSNAPFILVTGTLGEEQAVDCMKQGAADYVLKDRIHRLPMAIRRALDERRLHDEKRRAEDRYRLLFDSTPLSMWVYDLETLRVLAVNDAAVAIYGYRREEFLTMTIERLRPAEDVAMLREHLAHGTPPGFRGAGVWRHRRKNGEIMTVEIASHELLFEGRRAQLVVANDITARARTQAAQAALYRIAHASQAAANLQELFGSIQEIVGTLMPAKSLYIALYDAQSDLITFPYFIDERDPPPPARKPGRGITERVLESGAPLLVKPDTVLQGEESVGTPSQYWLGVPLKAGERTFGVLAVQTYAPGVEYAEGDKEMLEFVSTQIATVIERKRADDQVRQDGIRLRSLVDSALDAVITMDVSGTITGWNQRAEHLFGWPAAEAIGRRLADTIVPPAHREAHVRGLRHFLATGEGPILGRRLEITALHRDGSEFPVELSVNAVRLGDGWLFSAFLRDIRERKELEQQLRQAQKMEAVGRLSGGVAHDFNNVLTAVFGYVDLLREELPAGSGAQDDLSEIRKAAERAAALTKQLLAFSRQQVLQPVVLNINDLVHDIDKMLKRLLGEDVRLSSTLARDLGNVRADPGQIQQVLMNLVVNARDAMPRGGSLLIETANTDLSEQYAELHQPVVPGHYAMLAVSDTGTGMDSDTKSRMFEPFFTTKEKGRGTGLGLSTVYGIVKQSGGYIWVYSELGRGTTFKVYLPRVDAPAERAEAPRESVHVAGTETILLAEDDEMLRPLAKGLLGKLGYRVLEATDATSALALAASYPDRIHLLVSDVIMPGLSGSELANRLTAVRPETKVLYMSGYTDDAIVRHGILEHGVNFLQKPFTPGTLARKVREVLDKT